MFFLQNQDDEDEEENMEDEEMEDEEEEKENGEAAIRRRQMDGLRRLCLPQTAFLLLSVLQETGQHSHCLRLNDVLVSRQHELYKVFSKEQLKEVAQKIAQAMVATLEKGDDPWAGE